MTIAEVSRKYDISADTLRYYERIGLIPPVPRTRGGLRDYGEESCGWIQLMKCMRAAGVQIEALIEYVDLFQQGDATLDARKALLVEQRDQLVSRMAEMQAEIQEKFGDAVESYLNRGTLDIVARGVSKQTGVEAAAAWLKANEVYVIGDDYNDLPMIEGLNGLAMSSGVEAVKAAASRLFDTVDACLDYLESPSRSN